MTNGVQRPDTPSREQKSGLWTISGGMRGHAFGCGSPRAAITSVIFAAALAWPPAANAIPLLPVQPQHAQPAPEPAAAQTSDTKVTASATWTRRGGMMRYDRPVFHNGHRVLWHGAWRNAGRGGEAGARPAPARAVAAPTPPPADGRDIVVLADAADASATRMAAEFVQAMQGNGLHIKAVAGKTSIAALDKAVSGDAADLAIVPMDTLSNSSGEGADKIAGWRARAPYLARLANEPIALVAPRAIADIHQLAGRKVNVAAADGAIAASAAIVFSRLNIAPTMTNEPLPDALSRLARGEIDAVFVVGADDSKALTGFGKDGRFHVVPIPYVPALQALYCPMRLTARDEANLIGADDRVDTIGVPTALLALDAAPDSPRASRLAPLIDRLFAQFDQSVGSLQSSHWQDVNLAAKIAGWPRFGASQAWLDQNQGTPNAALDSFRGGAEAAASASDGPSSADSDKLYESLMKLSGAAQ
jgi:TRAP-type uncharacterized transport system substrate-binding protein